MASSSTSYNNDKMVTGEVEYPNVDPASGAFFQPDYKKNGDLKMMLDSSKDSLKLEAMKRIIGMIAKGKDASDLFPAVVKNVVSKNIEVKKLVYVYLVRYAEEQQDLALLSISTFQRALKDPNQLIRASALRVLSSIRVNMIVPIVMLAIRESASDMSPYVRKTAAHAIPKLYSLDPDQKEELVSIIDKLLCDKAPLVVGSAAMAFTEVCSERLSLIHKSYRKLCSLLADVDEWGQLVLLNVLTVYVRTYFPDPNVEHPKSNNSGSSSSSDSEEESSRSLDADHRLVLRASRPLLQTRNAGVVLAVAQLYYHCAPAQELAPVAKALIRLLRAHVEVQSVVLNTIATLTVTKKSLFEPYLKSFFIRNSDPTHIKLLKLDILTNLATESNAPVVLREFQTYVTASDTKFVAATIQAIGRLALTIETETETCLNGLLQLLSSKDESVVCEAVVVVKVVVNGGLGAHAAVVRAARLLRTDRLAAKARAAGVWLVAEHGAKDPRAAAVLAHLTQTFPDQEEEVKLQLLTLAMKLSITQPDTMPIALYIMQLARYDTSYDVRDRARMLSKFLTDDKWRARAADVFLTPKPKPTMDRRYESRQQLTVGSMSLYLGTTCTGFLPLPTAPTHVRDHDLRNTDVPPTNIHTEQQKKEFYSEPNSSGSGSSSSSDTSSSEDSSDEESETDGDKTTTPAKKKEPVNGKSSESGSSDSESDSETSSDLSESDDDESTEERAKNNTRDKKANKPGPPPPPPPQPLCDPRKSNLELLLQLDEVAGTLPTMTPTLGGIITPVGPGDEISPCAPPAVETPPSVLLRRVSCRGVSAEYRWTRTPHIYSTTMASVQVNITNHNSEEVSNIRIQTKNVSSPRSVHEFHPISLEPGATCSVLLGLDFADSIQPIEFTLICSIGEFPASLHPPVGELMRSVWMSPTRWDKEQRNLRGMNECEKKATVPGDEKVICNKVFETANVAAITSTGDKLRFSGTLLSSRELVLLSVHISADSTTIVANCGNMAIASLLANAVAGAFATS